MLRKKRLYIIPGFGESARFKNYKAIREIAKKYDYVIKPIVVNWREGVVMSRYIKEVKRLIPDDTKNDYILGFSFGALILASISSEKTFSKYIFCSTSSYFCDDIKNIPIESKKYFGANFINDLETICFPQGNLQEAEFIIGENDWIQAILRSEKNMKLWGGKKKLTIVKGAGHEMTSKKYAEVLMGALI